MSKTIKVRYEKGMLKPLEPVEFHEGEEIVLEVKNLFPGKGVGRFFGIIKVKGSKPEKEEDYYEYLSERASVPGQ